MNDVVKAGQVLAVLDTTRLKAQVLQAESSLASAEARVLQSDATVKEARANYARLLKVRELSGNKLPSQQDMDVAEATVARAEGEVAAAVASVAQARANLDAVRTDLSKTEIRSPINGVVLVRSVEPGQTVAASLQAPILFTLAEDLKKMELHVSVDEADVGSVEVGQQATFTVDAFPSRTFSAHITQVHFASSNTQKSSSASSSSGAAASATSTGVVTYETVLEVDNSELLLRPGMTATARDRHHEHRGRDCSCRMRRCASRRKGRISAARRAAQQRSAARSPRSCRSSPRRGGGQQNSGPRAPRPRLDPRERQAGAGHVQDWGRPTVA